MFLSTKNARRNNVDDVCASHCNEKEETPSNITHFSGYSSESSSDSSESFSDYSENSLHSCLSDNEHAETEEIESFESNKKELSLKNCPQSIRDESGSCASRIFFCDIFSKITGKETEQRRATTEHHTRQFKTSAGVNAQSPTTDEKRREMEKCLTATKLELAKHQEMLNQSNESYRRAVKERNWLRDQCNKLQLQEREAQKKSLFQRLSQ